MHVLGIDAGGTKTVCLLADDAGRIVGEGRGPGANFHAAGDLVLERVLSQVIDQAMGDRRIAPAAACIGIAGVDREPEACRVRHVMRRIGCQSAVVPAIMTSRLRRPTRMVALPIARGAARRTPARTEETRRAERRRVKGGYRRG